MKNQYRFRSWSEVVSFGSSDQSGVLIVEAVLKLLPSNELQIICGGLARGAGQCTVSLSEDSVIAETTETVTGEGAFTAGFVVDAQALPEVMVLRAEVDVGNTKKSDSALISINAAALPQQAVISGLDDKRIGYGAGNTDQLKLSYSFVRYDTEPEIFMEAVEGYLSNRILFDSRLSIKRYQRSEEVSEQTIERIRNTEDRRTRWRIVGDYLRDAMKQNTVPVEEKVASLIVTEVERARKSKNAGRSIATGGVLIRIPMAEDEEETTAIDADAVKAALDEIIAEARANLRLGVLFHERLRVRPMRLVPGEPIYQLSLIPGESVEIQQKTSTKTVTTLSEVTDRESERTSSLSSTWSTDLSSSIESASSRQNSTSVGAGIDGKIPKIDLGVGVDVAGSVSEANTISTSDTINRAYETTSEAASKLRSQHKIQLEISTEESSALSSTRRLRNSNRYRTQHHKFFKTYRKEQVSLERYDARLCLRLEVHDPAMKLRKSFRTGIEKIHPRDRALELVLPPAPDDMKSTENPIRIDAPPYWEPLVRPPWGIQRWKPWTGDLRQMFNVSPNLKLASMPDFYLVGWQTISSEPLYNADGTSSNDPNRITREDCGQTHQFIHYPSYPPVTIEVTNSFDLASEHDTQFGMRIDFPVRFNAPLAILDSGSTSVNYVEFDIETAWTADGAARERYRNDLVAMEAELTAIFDPDAVHDLVRIAEADYRETVLSEALQQSLSFPQGFDMQRVTQIFATEEAIVDSVGYWATQRGVWARAMLHDLVATLPANFAASDVLVDALTASSATVYLPIRPGEEEEAMSLLPEARNFAADKAEDFTEFRKEQYGSATNDDMPKYDVQLGPSLPDITDAGENEWKSNWEKPQRKFDVLGQWSEYVPTDGVHVETHLAESVVTDQHIAEDGE